jgi:arsenite oxidase large subunit
MDFLVPSQPGNSLAGRIPDWISGNYNYKMGVAKVKKIGESQYKKTFRSMSFAPRDIV